ncbi:DNA-binding transcriptional MerR regulator [Actinomycetospora cinnamomea]|uniref:DNA-binding transcriptional MerR regulator n=2 Tax=Actinomycetospora cinnamomea TaxID=663609 RepID=A0A2U1EBE5_9PSEU|nr:MerR family transcriptional regulator [Actinomycetospora cinnamomea]PVY97264.1 DNA-binding transcriptional MerR regulator [Actinomycetospora cinnamomea]
MAWSTRELAELAGTSLRSVRHYHDVGLLPEPERRSHGYKQYGVPHLMRLLRIKRLVDLGFSLAQIADLGDRDEYPEEALRALDAELVAQIERLRTLRTELAEILERRVPTDLPAELAVAGEGKLSEADRHMVSVMGRLLGEEERATYAALLSDEARMPSDDDFESLPADADEPARQDLAERMAEDIRTLKDRYPGLRTLGAQAPLGRQRYRQTLDRAIRDVYNTAQLDVLLRLRGLSREDPPA